MGAQIAAHLANAGLDVVLLDLSAQAARAGLDRLRTLKPDPCFLPDSLSRIRPASFDDLALLSAADWVIEAVIESLDVKRHLIARVARHAGPGAIVSSNTSAIPLALIADGRDGSFRRRWLGTHFFNPPRYLHLVELIPTADTDPGIVNALAHVLDRQLGKGTVVANDTPGFIANRIGIFGALRLIDAVASGEYTVEEIDAITGPAIGRPKSATFRTLDLAGLDVFSSVAADLAERPDAEGGGSQYGVPPIVRALVERGHLGAKTGKGFYARAPAPGSSESRILAIDPATLEYRDPLPVALPALDAARTIDDVRTRVARLFLSQDRVGALLRRTLGPTLVYAARVAPSIARAIDDVDRAMQWGFGWELGPFETWDAIGVERVLEACAVSDPPPLVRDVLATASKTFRSGPVPPAGPGLLILRSAREHRRIVRQNAGASAVDLGDGVLCVEFHSKMNAIGGDAIEMIRASVALAATDFQALVVGNEAEHFSAGANLMLLLLEAQEGNWDEVDAMVRAFQAATMALKTSAVPVVAAPAGLTLGGGCEICLHTDRVAAAAETYMGLVEVGVGLVPAGGGTKEMLIRAVDRAGRNDGSPWLQAAFETIGFAKVSTSAPDAHRLGYLRDVDPVTMNRERAISEAKAAALNRVREGYQPPAPRAAIPVGGAHAYAKLALGIHLARRAERISDHDALIGRKLAWILTGGDLPHPTTVPESSLLDLEREAFLSLCGQPKTLERIGYTLKTGKTLRN
jgi:3-hydroxyacyl-CoA dehydrogenase